MDSRRDNPMGGSSPDFGLLPDGKSRSGSLLAAIVVEIILAFLIMLIPTAMPQVLAPAAQVTDLLFPVAPVVKKLPPPAPRIHMMPPRVKPMNAPVPPAPRPKLEPRHVRVVEAPVLTPEFHAPAPAPVYHPIARPHPAIHTGVLSASVAPPKEAPPRKIEKVQTGGFGDPAGVAPANDNAHHAMTVATVGSFDSPVGPGSGNGTGGSRGAQGQIARAGFGDAVASTSQEANAQHGGEIRAGVFSNQAAVPTVRTTESHTAKPSIQPVEIIEKPDPVYTAEARARKIEGDVVLDVIFSANGSLDVLRVVRGLGYGLDQAAISAAQRIRFRPERVDGRPVDEHAKLTIVFRLAY
jgi:TonB family protein